MISLRLIRRSSDSPACLDAYFTEKSWLNYKYSIDKCLNVAIPGNQVYTATKAFMMSFSLAVEGENDESKITFQLVLPGTTITPFHEKQGVKPAAGTMYPDKVAKGSLKASNKSIYIPNRYDRIIPFLSSIFPKKQAVKIAKHQIKRRLGLNKKLV